MPTHGKPSQDESNIVLEFQSRVMSNFISDPAAWLRRERWHLKMDNSTTQRRGIKLDSNDIDENLVSPTTVKSRSEHCQLLDSSQDPERDADYLALDHAELSSTLRCQEFGFREDMPLEQLAYTDSQQRTTKKSWEMSSLVTLDAGILRTTSFEKHSDSLQSRRCYFFKAKEEKQLSTGIFDSICDESKRQ
ncbi:uncharacterized protein BKA55DRAFT_598131 [Fusarium redolens]|uniref:Uncharacterized protein n=1 Tax=Fusarium redolens TaxID=48865 RepID=A0A9P9G8H1_FUSRE|nr:uncharacterized protein BKA55DRAFT_598131 [Fusarium redolens]KAH7233945.1 hypothetical protein BKA55DRAFT_598131 [Fusarium redolens]